jgi:hypothetical protein
MDNDTWTLKVYKYSSHDWLMGVFDFRSKRTLREWCYAHVGAARMEWDNVAHICSAYLGGGTIE